MNLRRESTVRIAVAGTGAELDGPSASSDVHGSCAF